jgi:hypothetical protein
MRHTSGIKAALIGLACGWCMAASAQAQANLVLTAPAQVEPGQSFSVFLSLEGPWPLDPSEVVDQVDITLTYDAAVLLFVNPPVPGDLLPESNAFGVFGEVSTVSFLFPQNPFGPGGLLEYRFEVLPEALQALAGVPDKRTSITASVVPSMIVGDQGDLHPLAQLPAATTGVQVVPEPSAWLLMIAGLSGLILVRGRLFPYARRAGIRTQV